MDVVMKIARCCFFDGLIQWSLTIVVESNMTNPSAHAAQRATMMRNCLEDDVSLVRLCCRRTRSGECHIRAGQGEEADEETAWHPQHN